MKSTEPCRKKISSRCAPAPSERGAPAPAGQTGFSVLEAIAAIALLAIAMMPLLALQGQLARSALAIERAELAARHERNALAFLEAVNPTLAPQGEEDLGEARLVWRSRPVSAEKPALNASNETGRFLMRLYDVEARIIDASGRERVFVIRRVGWRPVAPYSEGVL